MTVEEKREQKKERIAKIRQALTALTPEQREQKLANLNRIITVEGHVLSSYNTCAIYTQTEETAITIVGGYQQWQRAGRQVQKGEQGFIIFVPKIKKEEEQNLDEDLQYITASVFDITQTEKIIEGEKK